MTAINDSSTPSTSEMTPASKTSMRRLLPLPLLLSLFTLMAFFTTPAFATPSIGGEGTSEVTGFGARLEANVNPNNEPTECHFQYGTAIVTENTVPCEQGDALEGEEQSVSLNVTGLAQQTLYKYRVVVKNATGKEEGHEEEFTTTTPEMPEDS